MSDTYIKKLAKLKITGINPDAENDIEHRVSKKIEEIKKDKKGLLIAADDYGKKYREEILEGTEKRALLLKEGKDKGLTEEMIKHFHRILKEGTMDSRKEWFNVGEYKKLANEAGSMKTSSPKQVAKDMQKLMEWYNSL